jgi:hypothetical protein
MTFGDYRLNFVSARHFAANIEPALENPKKSLSKTINRMVSYFGTAGYSLRRRIFQRFELW